MPRPEPVCPQVVTHGLPAQDAGMGIDRHLSHSKAETLPDALRSACLDLHLTDKEAEAQGTFTARKNETRLLTH